MENNTTNHHVSLPEEVMKILRHHRRSKCLTLEEQLKGKEGQTGTTFFFFKGREFCNVKHMDRNDLG